LARDGIEKPTSRSPCRSTSPRISNGDSLPIGLCVQLGGVPASPWIRRRRKAGWVAGSGPPSSQTSTTKSTAQPVPRPASSGLASVERPKRARLRSEQRPVPAIFHEIRVARPALSEKLDSANRTASPVARSAEEEVGRDVGASRARRRDCEDRPIVVQSRGVAGVRGKKPQNAGATGPRQAQHSLPGSCRHEGVINEPEVGDRLV